MGHVDVLSVRDVFLIFLQQVALQVKLDAATCVAYRLTYMGTSLQFVSMFLDELHAADQRSLFEDHFLDPCSQTHTHMHVHKAIKYTVLYCCFQRAHQTSHGTSSRSWPGSAAPPACVK